MESGIPMPAFNFPSSPTAMMMPPSSQLAQAVAAAALLNTRRDPLWSSPQLEEDERWYEFPAEPRPSSGRGSKRTTGMSRRERMTFPTTSSTGSAAGLHHGQVPHNAMVAATGGPQEPLSSEAAIKMLQVVVDAAGGVPRRAVEKRRRGHAVVPAVVAEDDRGEDPLFGTEAETSA